jgi:hypothetical protein
MGIRRLLDTTGPSGNLCASTYEDTAEVHESGAVELIHEFDDGGELRDIVSAIALTGYVEVAPLVLGEPLQPVNQEDERVLSRPRSPTLSLLFLSLLAWENPTPAGDSRKITLATAHHINQFSIHYTVTTIMRITV